MTTYIDLGKEPKDIYERKELIRKHLEQIDENETVGLNIIQQRVYNFLITEKGYPEDTIVANRSFKVNLSDISFDVISDLAIVVNNVIAITIKCAINSIESWERYSLAFARTAQDTSQIPFAIISDSEDYISIDVLAGTIIGRGKEKVPPYHQIQQLLNTYKPTPYAIDRSEREKRILYAFNGLKCSC